MSDTQSELEAALAQAAESPLDESVWDRLEDLAGKADDPDQVAGAYIAVLSGSLAPKDAETIGKRAAQFHQEWNGDDREGYESILRRVLELSPENEWAFQELTASLTIRESWDDAINVYQTQISRTKRKTRVIKLLDEAYQVTKDLANRPERAIDFLQAKYEIKPTVKQRDALERLLERHERWKDLIKLWLEGVDKQKEDQKLATHFQVAEVYFRKLSDVAGAVQALRECLTINPSHEESLRLIEELAGVEDLDSELRSEILDVVRDAYEANQNEQELVRVFSEVLPLCSEDNRKVLHNELGLRLGNMEEHQASLEHYAALLILDPASVKTQRAMHRAAQFTGKFEHYATALAQAADNCSEPARRAALLGEAATAAENEDPERAIDFLAAAVATENVPDPDVLQLGKRLCAHLERAERDTERLDVMDRMAKAESVPSARRALMGDAAMLAESLGDTDRALRAWRQRVDDKPDDLRALEAIVELLGDANRPEELIAALRAYTEQSIPENQKRSNLVRIAQIYETELEDLQKALATWEEIRTTFAESPDVVNAMKRILSELGEWQQLAELLEGASSRQVSHVSDQYTILGDAYRESLNDKQRAIECYRRALTVDPGHEGARDGLRELCQEDATRGPASAALVHALEATGDKEGLLGIVEARLSASDDVRKHIHILQEAVELARDLENSELAFTYSAKLLPLCPRDKILEERLVALAKERDAWEEALVALSTARQNLKEDPFAASEMQYREAQRLENCGRIEEARDALVDVVSVQPEKLAALSDLIRLAGQLGDTSRVVKTLLDFAETRDGAPEGLLTIAERAVQDQEDGYSNLCASMNEGLQLSTLPENTKAQFYARVATWQEEAIEDYEAARESLLRATELQPHHLGYRKRLVELQRDAGGNALYESYRSLSALEESELSHFVNAAEVALDGLGLALQEESLLALRNRAQREWREQESEGEGEAEAQKTVSWSIEHLVSIFLKSNQAERAMHLLVESSRLPFAEEEQLAMRKRAAAIATAELGDDKSAMEMLDAVLSQDPRDREAMGALGELYEKHERFPELLALKQRELAFTDVSNRAVELRLELATIIDTIEKRNGRKSLLLANLKAFPGHRQSIDSLTTLLSGMQCFAELADILESQAKILDEGHANGDFDAQVSEEAAELWEQAAAIAETELEDVDRALTDLRRVAVISPKLKSLDALARLYISKSQSASAIPWLEQAISMADETEKPPLLLRLSDAHLANEAQEQAVEVLEAATADGQGPHPELRCKLADIYRDSNQWENLAGTLIRLLPYLDQDELVTAAREASDLYHQKLGNPAAAIPALERALELVPEDRVLRLMMAKSLRESERFEEAAEMLDKLIEDFGRRRSVERAEVHMERARLARVQADLDRAMQEMDLASKMDSGNAHILMAVAGLARDRGEVEQAERSLRALLLVVRRQPPGDDESAVGISEVLFELSQIAAQQGEDEQHEELLESVLEAASSSDAETQRLRRTLVEYKEYELLLRVLRTRIELSESNEDKVRLLESAAELQAGPLDDREGAFSSRLDALALAPTRMDLHDAARADADALDELSRYVGCLESLISRQRRAEDAEVTSRLMLRAGKIAELELGELERARDFYQGAEKNTENPADALFALARVSAALEDLDEQTRALDALTELAGGDTPSPDQADALYRLAELQVREESLLDRGVELLDRALALEPRFRLAATILSQAADTAPENAAILEKYELAARQCGDKRVLLDFLERKTQRVDDTELSREAFMIATELEEHERVGAILERAFELSETPPEVDPDITQPIRAYSFWSGEPLARWYSQQSRFEDSLKILQAISEYEDSGNFLPLCVEVAERAKEAEKPEIAAEVLELAYKREPGLNEVWKPLMELYRELDMGEKVLHLADETLDVVTTQEDRAQLKTEKAKTLIASGEDDEAINLLREAILDDPDNIDSASVLESVLRKDGNEEALSDFLWQRFSEACSRGNPETVTDVAHRLGTLLEQIGKDSSVVYRQALDVAPKSPLLLRGVLQSVPEGDSEQGDLLERLLQVDDESAVPEIALGLADLRQKQEDDAGTQRALEVGVQRCPNNTKIRQRLESWYLNREDWPPLAQLKLSEAFATEDRDAKVWLLRAGAAIYRDNMMDWASASDALAHAHKLAPENVEVTIEFAQAQAASGMGKEAIGSLGETLDACEGDARLPVLLMRAQIHEQERTYGAALADLEEALQINRGEVEDRLLATLDAARLASQGASDLESERTHTRRLIELLGERGDADGVREHLINWTQRDPKDRGALRQLRDIELQASRWEGVLSACTHLVDLEEGAEQIQAALQLADAAFALQLPDHGRAGLERAFQEQPQVDEVRDRLRTVYTELGAQRELAQLLVADAQWTDDNEVRYDKFRSAADIYVNELGDPESAIVPAQAAKEIKPEDHHTVVLLADILMNSGKLDEAVGMLEPAIASHKRRSPELASLQHRMSRVAAARSDQDGQLDWLKKAFDVDRKDANIASELAHLATEIGDYELALKPLRAITLMDEPGPVSRVMALLWEAKIEHARGNRAKAELWAKKALREDPEYQDALQFLAEIGE